jgi:hypothetical protein
MAVTGQGLKILQLSDGNVDHMIWLSFSSEDANKSDAFMRDR